MKLNAIAIIVLTTAIPGCAPARPAAVHETSRATAAVEPSSPKPTTKPIIEPAAPREESASEVIGHSVNGEAITMRRFGTTGGSVLVLGGIHGNEPTSVDVAREQSGILARLACNLPRQ